MSRQAPSELHQRLHWLMLGRLLFCSLLLASTIVLHLDSGGTSLLARPLLGLYSLIVGIFCLSLLYAVMQPRMAQHITAFAYLQLGGDTLIVTLILFLTGGFSSIFSFLYIVIIICSSILLYRRGSLVIALLCSLQYASLVGLEYGGALPTLMPAGLEISVRDYAGSHVLYKVSYTILACFAVSWLSSMLAEQTRKTKRRLAALEDHVKRVEKMASMGEMAAGMVHEIKNPLASLAGAIQLLREDLPYNPTHDRLMQIVLRETDRLSTLVGNFLIFARPQTGKRARIQVDEAVMETVALFEKDGTCIGRITFDLDLAPELWVELDPVHLRQVLWNLLLNAAEAIQGQGSIRLHTHPRPSGHVVLQVADSGSGIDNAIAGQIFDPFFTTKANGSGLGLAIVHRLVESYGGWLEVDSEPGRGTTFSVVLKRAGAPAES
jgi:two-component system sensor histidine kinase PilS (NtrC family)